MFSKWWRSLLVLGAMLLTHMGVIIWGATPAAERGKQLFARRCGGCHALDSNKEGPRLRGVYGRKAGSLAEFGYSDSLKMADIRWNDATLDRWLSNPDAMAPGTDMDFRVTDAEERRALIAFLKDLGGR
jgi:cytochrome c